MDEPTVMPVKPGAISETDRVALREAGVIVIEVDDPASIRLLRPASMLSSDDLLLAAMRALNTTSSLASQAREQFAQHVLAAMTAKAPK